MQGLQRRLVDATTDKKYPMMYHGNGQLLLDSFVVLFSFFRLCRFRSRQHRHGHLTECRAG
jgi:hypothetical protein